jgi:hypothetical protein
MAGFLMTMKVPEDNGIAKAGERFSTQMPGGTGG